MRVDITPPTGISMGTNFRDDETFAVGVHDNLYADIIVFENNGEYIVLVDLDWCEASIDIIRPIKQEIANNTGINYTKICVTMTHTHSAPDTYGCLSNLGISKEVGKYIEEITSRIASGVKEAVSRMEEVFIGAGKGYEDKLSFNRRILLKNGDYINNWEAVAYKQANIKELDRAEGPIDPDVYVIKICNNKGKLKAIIINFTLHPTTLERLDLMISKDYIGPLEESLHKTYGEDVLIYFANGALGNINHMNAWDNNQNYKAWSEAERVGLQLSNDVKQIMKTIKVKEVNEMKLLYKSMRIPMRHISKVARRRAEKLMEQCGREKTEISYGCPPEWYAQSLLKMVSSGKKTEEIELHAIKIGDIVIISFPAENFVEFGLEIKKKSPYTNTIIFGLANLSIGYVPTKHAI